MFKYIITTMSKNVTTHFKTKTKNVSTAKHPLAFCRQRSCRSLHWNISKNVSSEISKSEEGGRRGVLLPGKERCRTCTVSFTNDGSLWVSERLSHYFVSKIYVRVSSQAVLLVLCIGVFVSERHDTFSVSEGNVWYVSLKAGWSAETLIKWWFPPQVKYK